MQELQWQQLAGQVVRVSSDGKEKFRLGKLLGSGGAGAVYDIGNRYGCEWVLKVLAPDSPVAEQEFVSLDIYRGNFRYQDALMKFNSWSGTLEYNDERYSCYMMRKGRPLSDAVQKHERWLDDPKAVMRFAAYLVNGICALKNAGFSHGDIKEDNILLIEHRDKFYPVFSDYGTVSDRKHNIRTNSYHCDNTEYDSPLEERIAYDLHCLYMVLSKICAVEDDILPVTLDKRIFKLLRTMRSPEKKAFDRLSEIMNLLKKYRADVPVSFYLDAIPTYELTEDFPFEKVMQWGEYTILRDKNATPFAAFDPLLLLPIESGRYEKVYKILVEYDKLNTFVMPIARYFDKDSNEYVMIHAPDDRNKHPERIHHDFDDVRIQDGTGVPYTLDLAHPGNKKEEMTLFINRMTRRKINIEFSYQDIWHLDKTWKLNLFSVKFLEFAENDATACRISWKR